MIGEILILMLVSLVLMTVYAIIGTVSNYHLKKRLIDSDNLNDDLLKALNRSLLEIKLSTLKWAIILFFGSLGLLIFPFLSADLKGTTFIYGLEGFLLAMGLTVYYFLVKNLKEM